MPIVWEKPDGSLRIMQLSEAWLAAHRLPHETTDEAVLRLAVIEAAKNTDLADASPSLVKTADLPATRENRKQWTLRNGRVT